MKTPSNLVSCSYESPLGTMLLAATDAGLAGVWFEGQRHGPDSTGWVDQPGHPMLRRPMTLETYASLHHAVVMTPARSDDLFDRFLERQGLKRHVSVRTPHHLSLVAIVAGSDLIATVPLATACYFADLGAVKLLALPFTPPIFNVQQHWHRRSHVEPRTRWLRQQIATLFNDQTDIWLKTERGLYGKIRGKTA